ncbi:unnamed protein product, partial [Darwinula stevensoni]
RITLDKETVIQRLYTRGLTDAKDQIQAIWTLDTTKLSMQVQLETLAAKLNKLNKEIGGALQQQGETETLLSKKQEINGLKVAAKDLAQKLKEQEMILLEKLYQLPNLPDESVPFGIHAGDNQILYQTPTLPTIVPDGLAHWDLIKKYDLVNFELGNKITGAGFPIYKGKEKATEAGYIEIQPPILVNETSAYATGQLPDKGQMYHVTREGLYLIPTAELYLIPT